MDQKKRINVLRDWAAGKFRPPVPQQQNGDQNTMLPTETVYKPTSDIECHRCDFRQLPIENGKADAIITDIPWDRPWVRHIPDFGKWCAKVLRPGGVMATIYTPSNLDRCVEALKPHLTYQWLFIVPFCGGIHLNHPFLSSRYRPVLVYTTGEPLHLRRAVDDWTPTVRALEKDLDPHQQTVAAVQHLVEAFSEEGGIICDPCAGSFTTAEACWLTGRQFIGGDIRPQCLGMARARFEKLLPPHNDKE